jgi:glycosyltransferase involved in cell wall biosynthesis
MQSPAGNNDFPYLSIVLPVYNESESLPHLHKKVIDILEKLGHTWEIIYVDDGSTDNSKDQILEFRQQNNNVILAVQRRNLGKSLALNVGFALARGRIVITMDSDLQDNPDEIPRLLEKLDEGYDLVTGWKENRQDPLSKTIPSWIANRMTTMMSGLKLRDMNSGLKCYRVECAKRIHLYGDLHRYVPLLAHYAGFRVTEIPVVHYPRQYGQSKYGAERFLRGGLDLITVMFLQQYGRRPLHLFGSLGVLMMITGFLINLMLTIQWFMGMGPLSDRPLLILGVLLIVVGVQFLTMGLLAELVVSNIQRSESPLDTVFRVYSEEDDNQH